MLALAVLEHYLYQAGLVGIKIMHLSIWHKSPYDSFENSKSAFYQHFLALKFLCHLRTLRPALLSFSIFSFHLETIQVILISGLKFCSPSSPAH